ncbi:HD domain-containing protein [Pseudomonas phage D6]|nr:HD domain-containing protein [Pseudomonas phage D6]
MYSKVDLAKAFCVAAHSAIGQKRKYILTDYHEHPHNVRWLVRQAENFDENMEIAALLHDVVEDTQVTLDTIEDMFGADVRELVEMLTDVSKPEDGNRDVRKALDRAHTAKASPRAKTIKLCDLIDNAGSIQEHDAKFAKIYMHEKRLLLEVLTEGDPKLYAHASKIVNDYFKENPECTP